MTDQQGPLPQGHFTGHQSGHGGPVHPGHQGHPEHMGHQGHPGDRSQQGHPGHERYSIDSGSTSGYVPPPPNYRHQYRLQSIATTTSRPSMDVRDLMVDDDDFNSHFALSVFSTACCCLPIGILAISKSQDATQHHDRGDLVLAQYAAMDAKRYAHWSMAVGTIVFVVIAMAVIIILSYHL